MTLQVTMREETMSNTCAIVGAGPGMGMAIAKRFAREGFALALNPVPRYASLALGKAGLRSLAFSLHEELKDAGIHVATVTIAGFVEAGTHFDPDKIADAYWELHTQAPDAWEPEIVYN